MDGLKANLYLPISPQALDIACAASIVYDFVSVFFNEGSGGGKVTLCPDEAERSDWSIDKLKVRLPQLVRSLGYEIYFGKSWNPLEGSKEDMELGFMWPYCKDMNHLIERLSPLMKAGRLMIRPKRVLKVQRGRKTEYLPVEEENPLGLWDVIDYTEDSRPMRLECGEAPIDREIDVIRISIPFLSGIDPGDLSHVLNDEKDHIAKLRVALRKIASGARAKRSDLSEMVNDDVRPIIEKLDRQFRKVDSIHKLKASGIALGTASLSLAALTTAGWTELISSILGAGGLGLLASERASYLERRNTLTEDPLYLLWRCKNLVVSG